MVGLDDAIKQGTKEGIEESIEQGVKQSAKQLIEESMTTATKSTLESTFGRQIPKSYLDATGEQLTKSGAEKFYRTSVRRMIREGGENGPKQALEATVKALGVTQAEAAEIVVGNLGVTLTRQGADEAVQLALKASGRSLKEIICATPSVIRGFLRSVYDNAIRLGKNPKQALRQTKKLKESIAFKRAALTLGVPAAGAVIIGAGYSIYNIFTDMRSAASNPSEEQAETQSEEPPSTPSQVIGQSIVGLSAIGIGGVALLSVLMLGGGKDKAVAASEGEDPVQINRERTLENDGPWVATCAPDGTGECALEIDTLEELLQLERDNKIEIPEYSHDTFELLLYDCGCDSGRYNG